MTIIVIVMRWNYIVVPSFIMYDYAEIRWNYPLSWRRLQWGPKFGHPFYQSRAVSKLFLKSPWVEHGWAMRRTAAFSDLGKSRIICPDFTLGLSKNRRHPAFFIGDYLFRLINYGLFGVLRQLQTCLLEAPETDSTSDCWKEVPPEASMTAVGMPESILAREKWCRTRGIIQFVGKNRVELSL